MDFLDFFGQPGVMSLCVMTIGASVVLLVMVWWIVYRRNTRAKRERGEMPPKAPKTTVQPAPARSRSGVWGAIVNFFMEPEDARKAKAAAPASGAQVSGAPDSGAPAGAHDGKGPSPDGSSAAVEAAAQDPAPQEPAAKRSTLGPVVSFGAPAATAAAAPAERPASEGRMPLPRRTPATRRQTPRKNRPPTRWK
ncbi:MAG: hypothetical protein M5R40_20900 [Anaerolineae bacterium]|nr:hypothetical protein [Anaerolineae bacterium]